MVMPPEMLQAFDSHKRQVNSCYNVAMRFIINIPGRGYRFVASIKVPGDEN
jgi:DNA-binding winged helix-turn-helix (wHTH) protein